MKRTITLLLLLLLGHANPANSQPYQSMFSNGDSTTAWKFRWLNFVAGMDSAFVEKDTSVHGVVYKKIIAPGAISQGFAGGLLREDVNLGHVWYRDITYTNDHLDTLEKLAFRFDLNVGDTFDISNTMLEKGSYPDSFNIVDSIRMVNGLKHIYFKGFYSSYNEPYTIIEGIGSNLGIFWKHRSHQGASSTTVTLGFTYLLCSYKAGQKTPYRNKQYNGACNTAVGSVNDAENNQEKITLYPQPARNEIYIRNKTQEKITRICIVSQIGIKVLELSSPDITAVNIEGLPSGYYFLNTFSNQGYMTTKPMIIR